MVKKYSLTFSPTSEPITSFVTKFGGQPVWPEQPQWPVSRTTGEPQCDSSARSPWICLYFLTCPDTWSTFSSQMGRNLWTIPGIQRVARMPSSSNLAVMKNRRLRSRLGPTLQTWTTGSGERTPVEIEYSVGLVPGEDPDVLNEDEARTRGDAGWDEFASHWSDVKLGGTPSFRARRGMAVRRPVRSLAVFNAVLVAPQLAVNALNSSAGRFWEPGVFAQFLREAGDRLTELYGDARARGAFHNAPVVVAAYSGGYNPAAFVLQAGRADDRLRGVVLFDALYGEHGKFLGWLEKRPPAFFVSTFGKSSREENTTLQRMLTARGISFQNALPANLARGSVTFIAATDDVKHTDFMTAAWVDDPLKVVLRRILPASRARRQPPPGRRRSRNSFSSCCR